MTNCGGYSYSKSKCGQVPKASSCAQVGSRGQMTKTTSSCGYQRAPACQQAPKATQMTPQAASRIQCSAGKTTASQEFKASAQSSAAENLNSQAEKKKEEELEMSFH